MKDTKLSEQRFENHPESIKLEIIPMSHVSSVISVPVSDKDLNRRFLVPLLAAVLICLVFNFFGAAKASASSYYGGYQVGKSEGFSDGRRDGYRNNYKASYDEAYKRANSRYSRCIGGACPTPYYDAAFVAGYQHGYRYGYDSGFKTGRREGRSDGRVDGQNDGERAGMRRQMRDCSRRGDCSQYQLYPY